jgi:hypothetical protein
MRRLALAIGSTPVTVRNLTDVKLSRDSFPGVGSLYSQRYLELLLRQEALSVLANARSLQTKVLLDPTRVSTNDMDYHLSRRERLQLQHYAKQLTASVLQLVDSRRSDNGYPLLLAIARYQAVQRSLEANRLFLLDAFSDAALMVNRQTLAQQRTLTPKLANRARQVYEKNRKAVFAMEQLDESAYNRLESAGSRYYEVQRGLLGNSSVRVERGRLLPSRSRPLRFDSSHAKRAKLFGYLEVAKTNQLAYWNQLRKIYAYRLIRRNCATELSRGINSAFSRPEEVRKALGDFLAPGEEFTFIPFRLFHEVQRRFRVSAIKILPSYRKRRLAQMYDQENPAKVYWRETNVLTSTIYDGIAKDSTFLLFTDDVVWPRPFYGMLNLFYGLVHAGAGLFTLPVDKGKRMVEGLRGVFFSLPELFFFNIRKGSFEFVEDDALDGESHVLQLSTTSHRNADLLFFHANQVR